MTFSEDRKGQPMARRDTPDPDLIPRRAVAQVMAPATWRAPND
ncbi:MAG: hypothetical protein N4A39_00715 [Roseicyclus sp.]|jgi:hypothetical protein|nr:hypothetical protein [Roseicyclus sp.]